MRGGKEHQKKTRKRKEEKRIEPIVKDGTANPERIGK